MRRRGHAENNLVLSDHHIKVKLVSRNSDTLSVEPGAASNSAGGLGCEYDQFSPHENAFWQQKITMDQSISSGGLCSTVS